MVWGIQDLQTASTVRLRLCESLRYLQTINGYKCQWICCHMTVIGIERAELDVHVSELSSVLMKM
jgi:hypothetical protein